jgi:hypothetical protein
MGNRGCLHDDQGRIKRLYQGKRWIICKLEFKGRRRHIMAPGKYTELFFLDEATALAAGHRPCAECSRPRFKEFVSAWQQANSWPEERIISVRELDTILHQERIQNKEKKIYVEQLSNLPSGTFITLEGEGQAYLVLEDRLLPWQPEGYCQPIALPNTQQVQVLTPQSVVQTLRSFQPEIHVSAFVDLS